MKTRCIFNSGRIMRPVKRFFIAIACLYSIQLTAQETAQALGDSVFAILKSKKTARMDHLVPSYSEVMEIYQSMGLELSNRQKKEFPEKYRYHCDILKKKCAEIASDSTELNINWAGAVLQRSESTETPIRLEADSTNPTRTVIRHSLGIYFTTGKKSYLIRLKDIYLYKDTWRLGENIGIRELEPGEQKGK